LSAAESASVSVAELLVVSSLVVVAGRESSPSSVGVNLDVVAGDSSGARSSVPGQNSSASDRSSLDGRSSRRGSSGVGSGLRPDTDRAGSSADSEADRGVAAVGSSNGVKREAVRVTVVGDSVVLANSLELTIGSAVLELVSDGTSRVVLGVGVPVHVNAVSGAIELNGRSSESRSSLGLSSESESLSSDRRSTSLAISENVGSSDADVASSVLSELSRGKGAGVSVAELLVVVNTSAADEGSPLSIGVDLNVVAGDASRARSLVPGDSSGRIASSSYLSSTDGGSSGGGGSGVSDGIGPLADGASRRTDSEADR